MLVIEDRTIGGKQYQIRVLNVAEARKVYQRVQQLLAIVGDENLAESGLDPILVAGMSGALKENDLDYLCEKFGPTTTVDMGDGRVLVLKADVQNDLFAGNFEHMFEWLAACISVNFGGVIAKMRGALSTIGDKARAGQPKDA